MVGAMMTPAEQTRYDIWKTRTDRLAQIERENEERLKLRPTGEAHRDRLVRARLNPQKWRLGPNGGQS